MSRFLRALLVVAATTTFAAPCAAADKPAKTSGRAAEAFAESAAEDVAEPLLVIPDPLPKADKSDADQPTRGTASGPRASTSRTASSATAEARSATTHHADRGAATAPAQPLSRATASKRGPPAPQLKRDSAAMQRAVRTAAEDEPTEEPGPLPEPKSTRKTSSKPRPKTTYRQAAGSAFYEGANPNYHPARVPRRTLGWHAEGTEPAAPPPEAIVAPEGMPAPGYGGGYAGDEEFMPYGDYEGGFDGGYGGGYDGDPYGGGYDGYGCGDGCLIPGKMWTVVAGGEALWIRPRFSESAALTRTVTSQNGSTTTTTGDRINFDPGYQGGFRTYLGFRNARCGDEVRFTYSNFNGIDRKSGTATSNTAYCDFLCNSTTNPGDVINTSLRLNVNVWDLDFIRPFFFNASCGDCCGPGCPPWDLRWFGGLRIGSINHFINSDVIPSSPSVGSETIAASSNKFTGFGPRMGLQGRRYFGPNGRWSLYAKGAGSLLVGNVAQYISNSSSAFDETNPIRTTLSARDSRIVPVAELEIGATWRVLPRLALSGGWNLQTWWDLGLQEVGSNSQPLLDDSNILGFDSFFLRGEFVF
ncbi:MAG: hypothetical protein HYX69_13165 [Planctomycetia bacterium]|nr:hypothetical protein [Planctomycetia bacterium]